ncbi:MAG: phosphate butyryltransferase [Prevotella sp.]|nr:phosphate butyryltransferase [Prevotella sp.]MBR3067046.1 phosphate butyryltransferase [Prevotella sp.]
MKAIENFEELIAYLGGGMEPKRVAVVCPYDESTQGAVRKAMDEGFVKPILVGDPKLMGGALKEVPRLKATDDDDAAAKAVELVRQGMADVLMKGMLNTDNLLRAVLNKQTGILQQGKVLTHLTCAQLPDYDKLLFMTDVAVIPQPTKEQRQQQLRYVLRLCRSMGIKQPGVALINCSEKVDERHFPHTVEYRELVKEAEQGTYGECIVDGPLDLKTSLSGRALKKKGLSSPLRGHADALIFPDIQAGNVFYKTITLFCHATTAAILAGPDVPVVLTSRADDVDSKFYSLALACVC